MSTAVATTSPPPPSAGSSSRRPRPSTSTSSSSSTPRRSPRLATRPSSAVPPPPASASASASPSPSPFPYNASNPEEASRRARLAAACEGLSSLCSQYHASDYNRLKWGAAGAPVPYCPLTVLAPEHVEQVMRTQAEFERVCACACGSSDSDDEDDADSETAPETPSSSWTWERVEVEGEPPTRPSSPSTSSAAAAAAAGKEPRSIRSEEGLEGTAACEVTERGPILADPIARGVQEAMSDSITAPVKTSHSHPINVSFVLPPGLLPALRPALLCASPLAFACPRDVLADVLAAPPPLPAPLNALHPGPRPTSLGNLFLSSCPGKKVRLDGPVRGRGAICRDLGADLGRIRSLGVGCIVCCLDDDELSFLGAPWQEYARVAAGHGLDVVRIPMPEGLAPASIETFDSHLDRIVRRYTLRGTHVLAHCRGGVGRAGLTACAWAIKLGVVGSAPELEPHVAHMQADERERCRVMSCVERAICLVRRRRSVKAIETFEQVNFLVSYVAWLRRGSALAGS